VESDPVRYSAVPAAELAVNMERQTRQLLDYLQQNMPVRENPRDPFFTLSGKTHIVNKIKNLIEQARERIYISAAPAELGYVLEEVGAARRRGLKIVVITSEPFPVEGITVYYSQKQPGQIRLIADSSHVLTGELSEDPKSTCLYSQNTNLVQLIKDSLTNEIQLIKVTKKENANEGLLQ
jgi:HTH-type transcriptional regulator, sugar sensing transcriptional regulator